MSKETKKLVKQAGELKDKIVDLLTKEDPEMGVVLSVLMSMTVQTALQGMSVPPHELIYMFSRGVCVYVDENEEDEESEEEDEQTISRTTH